MTDATMHTQWHVARALAYASSHGVLFSRIWYARTPQGWVLCRPVVDADRAAA